MRLIGFILLLVALATEVRGEYQFEILLDDMIENVECFDPESCGPIEGHGLVTHLGSQMQYWVPMAFTGPDGVPLAYQFVLQGDGILPQGGNNVDYLEIVWAGPDFHYVFTWHCPDFISCNFTPQPYDPPRMPLEILPADGCDPPDYPLVWNHARFADGRVQLEGDFIVEPEETLRVAPGMRVEAGPWGGLRILGTLFVEGTADSSVVFIGQDWRGIRFQESGGGRLEHARISGVDTDTDGGALSLASGCEVDLDHCILHHNTAMERGGGAFVADGAMLRMRSCTVSHNGATSGGNLYVEGNGVVSGYYNLITFGTPHSMACEVGPLASNLQFSLVYPLLNPSEGTGWYCDPGYADPANGVFSISYWNTETPGVRNCVIDVAVVDEDVDPDGTPKDMGAIPFEQSSVLHAATILEVADWPGDQGGLISLAFAASPNDGGTLNAVSFYSIWVQHPGTGELVPSGRTVGVLGLPGYSLLIPTRWDSTASNGAAPDEYQYTFVVCTHSALNAPQHVFSEPVSGYSIDNVAPEAVTGFAPAGEWVEDVMGGTFSLDLEWDYCPAGDFDHFRLYCVDPDLGEPVLLGEVQETRFCHVVAYTGNLCNTFIYTIVALDLAGNESPASTCSSPVSPVLAVGKGTPLSFALDQNHPNPFNPSTSVCYTLDRTTDVSLRVYNVQGQVVRELVGGVQPAGHYRMEFDAGNLASGVYICHLLAGDFSRTRRMVLMK